MIGRKTRREAERETKNQLADALADARKKLDDIEAAKPLAIKDVVMLISGGPGMTVGEICPDGTIGCWWAKGEDCTEHKVETFPPCVLMRVPTGANQYQRGFNAAYAACLRYSV